MKKTALLIFAALMLVSCGSNHSEYTVTVDDVPFTSRSASNADYEVYTPDNELTQIFEVIPGTYTVTSDIQSEGVISYSDMNMTLKLRLLRPVEKGRDKDAFNSPYICVNLLDANDNVILDDIGTTLPALRIGKSESKSNGQFIQADISDHKDAVNEFWEFLQSPAGTEAEITFGSPVAAEWSKQLKNLKGIEIYITPTLRNHIDKKSLDDFYWKWKE